MYIYAHITDTITCSCSCHAQMGSPIGRFRISAFTDFGAIHDSQCKTLVVPDFGHEAFAHPSASLRQSKTTWYYNNFVGYSYGFWIENIINLFNITRFN